MIYKSTYLKDIKNGGKCTTTQMHWLKESPWHFEYKMSNPMWDDWILKATLSAGFCTKKLYFSCIKNYKGLKNHVTNPTELLKSLIFNKFPKFYEKKMWTIAPRAS